MSCVAAEGLKKGNMPSLDLLGGRRVSRSLLLVGVVGR
jgi:hypothetical protein